MKVVMLGNTAVGKTTYMSSLYGIMSQGIEDFSLRTANQVDNDYLSNIARNVANGKYPISTAARSNYNFWLKYQDTDVFEFDWADYRGSAIREEISNNSSGDVKSLIQSICEADGIMILCDCGLLEAGSAKVKSEIRRMTVLITQSLQKIDHPISIAIALTKSDTISSFSAKHLQPFESLIEIISANEYAIGGFIPISCGHQFLNVPMPLLFALHTTVTWRAVIAQKLVEYHYQNYQTHLDNSQGLGGFLRYIGDQWNGQMTDEEKAKVELEQAIEMYNFFEFIKSPVLALNEYLNQILTLSSQYTLHEYAMACNKLRFYQSLGSGSFSSSNSWF